MIPKVIHYCWFGGKPLPELAEKCISSWKEFCPDYEIKRWDESNIDLNENDFIREAHEAKKWAFITDYVRLKVLYEFGGVYMDTDVQVCKSLDPFLNAAAFSGFENDHQIPTGIMASEKGHSFIGCLLSYYNGRHFLKEDGSYDVTTNVEIITEIGLRDGFVPNNTKQEVGGMVFYPRDYFCPKDNNTGEIFSTENTVCIHHFDGSWLTQKEKDRANKLREYNKRYGKYGTVMYKFSKLRRFIVHPNEFMIWIKERKSDNTQ